MKALALTLIFGAAVAANAQVIDTYPFWDGNMTGGWNSIAQSFDAQGSVLTDYQFGIEGNPAGGLLTISLFDWVAGVGPTGSALYSTNVAWPASAGDVILSGINVGVTMGSHYGMVVDLNGENFTSVHYMSNTTGNPSGHGYWKNDADSTWSDFPGLSTEFRATFSSVPEPASMAVVGLGVLALARRRRKN